MVWAMGEPERKMREGDRWFLPVEQMPNCRVTMAVERGVEKQLLFKTWGGIGDQVCAEPTIRYALKAFKGCQVSLASEHPEFFRHLSFKRVFDLKHEQPIWQQYLVFDTIHPTDHVQWQFMSHMLVNCVDYVSLCALRCQLPVSDREVKMDTIGHRGIGDFSVRNNIIAVHPGRHWPSKTFPKEWWDAVLATLVKRGSRPVLIGSETDDNRGTVDVCAEGCDDWRGKMSLMETAAFLQHDARVLLTNDSAPLHLAAPGEAWIGYVATCKHPDMISHWRRGAWSWRMQNLGLGGVWDVVSHCPNQSQEVTADQVAPDLLASWLPRPEVFAEWALSRLLVEGCGS